jgi:hypothetical protein
MTIGGGEEILSASTRIFWGVGGIELFDTADDDDNEDDGDDDSTNPNPDSISRIHITHRTTLPDPPPHCMGCMGITGLAVYRPWLPRHDGWMDKSGVVSWAATAE